MMKFKTVILIGLFNCLGMSSLLAGEGLTPTPSSIEQCISKDKTEGRNVFLQDWIRQDSIPDRVSFPTRTGFVLLRKKDIVFIKVDSKSGEVLLQYRKDGQFKQVTCQINLINAFAKLEAFPFVKVSRSTIVNMNEIDQLEGTRRDAHLLMNDGSKIKVSRTMAGAIHDWMNHLGTRIK